MLRRALIYLTVAFGWIYHLHSKKPAEERAAAEAYYKEGLDAFIADPLTLTLKYLPLFFERFMNGSGPKLLAVALCLKLVSLKVKRRIEQEEERQRAAQAAGTGAAAAPAASPTARAAGAPRSSKKKTLKAA